jgi:hypothetical protein
MSNSTSTSLTRLAARGLAVLFLAALAGCEEESSATDGGGALIPTPPCHELLSEPECTGRQDCAPLSAWEYIPERRCRTDVTWVGCQSVEWGCSLDPVYALSTDGGCFSFGDYCIPRGWINLSVHRESRTAECPPPEEGREGDLPVCAE